MFYRFVKNTIACRFAVVMSAAALAVPAVALEKPADELEKLKACEEQICSIILKKETSGDDLACNIGRTWEKSKIVDGVKEKKISWSFGDARCTIDVNMKRQAIVDALTKPSYDFVSDKHTIKCQVERAEGVDDVSLDMAPKMSFKDGKVDKIWLNVSNIEAPTLIKTGLWTVSKLEDNIGLFHSEMVKETNEFIHEKCAKRYPN